MDKIVQWNIRGFNGNYEELQILLKDLSPNVLALQETLLAPGKKIKVEGYSSEIEKPATITDNDGLSGGVCLLIKKSLIYSPVHLNTNLQAVAARITLHKTITVCSLYLSPSVTVYKQDLLNLIQQLPKPYLLLGDFNGHSPVWGSDHSSTRGLLLENIFLEQDLCVLNEGSPTYFYSPNGTFSCLDLSVSDPSLVLDFEWSVHNDLHGSDHFPVILSSSLSEPVSITKHFLFKKANWDLFTLKVNNELNEEIVLNSEDPAGKITSIILDSAKLAIPTSSETPQIPKTPWFDEECRAIRSERKKAQRLVFRQPSEKNVRNHQKLRAKSRHIYKLSRRKSWKQFVSSLKFKVSTKKVWKVIKKIKGKNTCPSFHHLKLEDHFITEKQAVANLLASTIHNNSSYINSTVFSKIKSKRENKSCNFNSDNCESYNMPFTLDELKSALQSCNDSAAGPDEIHYSLLKHLSESSLICLLKVYNHIWTTGSFPPSWRKAHIIPIPKPGKDLSNPSNYRPIALTSCICKLMEKMVNCRLMWYLETEGLLAQQQCGFRKYHSTVDHLIRLESTIRNAFINKKHVIAIFFDLEKAYDTTWKFGILSDLSNLGFRGRLPLFIKKLSK